MDEIKAREIHDTMNLSAYTHEELRQADEWVKVYALNKLQQHLKAAGVTKALSEYVMLMACCHYGSVETDALLTKHQCYPDWMGI